MAYKEVSRVEITEIIRQWQAGRGIREITRSTGLARNTIRKYLLTAQSCGLVRDGPPPTESQLINLVQLNRAGPRQVAVPTRLSDGSSKINSSSPGFRSFWLAGIVWYPTCPCAVLS
jgi:predicted transcriptional regulator